MGDEPSAEFGPPQNSVAGYSPRARRLPAPQPHQYQMRPDLHIVQLDASLIASGTNRRDADEGVRTPTANFEYRTIPPEEPP